jgi:TonB family protein
MDNTSNKSFWISLALHILLLFVFLSIKNTNFLIPARSNGMEVELIPATDNVLQNNTVREVPQLPPKIDHIENTNPAQVNINQPPKKIIMPKIDKPKVIASTPVKKVQSKPSRVNKPKPIQTNQLSDLISDLKISTVDGQSKGQATGGNNNGTSDSNNLTNNYADEVISMVKPFVIIPSGVTNSAIVEVTLLPNMQVYNIALIHSSGSSDYDKNVIQAIKNGAPVFPPLPPGAKFVDYRKIKLTFKPQ